MKRSIYHTIQDILFQKNGSIVLYGPPATGKSYLLRCLSEDSQMKNYIYCDLNVDVEFRTGLTASLSNGSSISSFLTEYFNLAPEYVKDTLYFLMDGTECLKSDIKLLLQRETPLHFALTTSRIDYFGQNMQEWTNRHSFIKVSSMTFYEFLDAVDENDTGYTEILSAHYTNRKPIPGLIEDEIMELFHDYLMVGGYPEAVLCYLKNRTNLSEIRSKHEQLFATTVYRYTNFLPDGLSALRIHQLFQYIRDYAADYKGKFAPGHIRRGAQQKEYMPELEYLFQNGILIPMYQNDTLYRFEICDCGLLRYLANDYHLFYTLDQQELLPEYFYQNYLCHVLFHNDKKITLMRSDSNSYSPYYDDKTCILLLKNHSEISLHKSIPFQDDLNRIFLRLLDRKIPLKNGDHNISYCYLEETQF